MPDMSTILGTRLAFSSYGFDQAVPPGFSLAELEGGGLRAFASTHPEQLLLPPQQTHFGFVARSDVDVICNQIKFRIPAGFYFSLPGPAILESQGNAYCVIISKPGYDGFLQVGQLEERGRLRYINGCSDSLLIAPIKKGDPCLNLLYFPPNTDQTMHTHPSDRIGMILSGRGDCITDDERGRVVSPLKPGMLFCIHRDGQHKFRTYSSTMRVLAYHPDSDFGPTDEDHPMINRTIVDGVSASKLTDLHTQ